MEHNCERHTFEVAEGVCRSCRGSFCPDCLLYAFGKDEEPYCKSCAIAAGGIRSTAGNPRRITADERASKKRSGGLLSRLRRGGDATVDHAPELTPEELLELEAQEARKLLDAQRLPTEEEVEEEPEPIPTPNIAPPGSVHEERELHHRAVPEGVSGGLDLRRSDEVDADEEDREDDPTQAMPEPAATVDPSDSDPAPETVPDSDPAPETVPASSIDSGVAPEPEVASVTTPLDTNGSVADSDPSVPDWALPAPDAPPAPAEPAPAMADGHQFDDAGPESPAAATGATTADGLALFAPAADAPQPVPPRPDPEPAIRATDPDPVPEPVGGPVGEGPRIGQQARDETAELLRRIADLRGG